MLHRLARINTYEYGEVLEIVLNDSLRKPNPTLLTLRFPLEGYNFDLYTSFSCHAVSGVAVNQISTELFWFYHFRLEHRDWKERLAEYDDFCSNRL